MSPKSSVEVDNSHSDVEREKVQSSRAVPADAFDQFIEEQLQRANGNYTTDTVTVCHVY